MESIVCSRDYLKSLPQQVKEKEIQGWISLVKRIIIEKAQKGDTSCVFTLQPATMAMKAMPCNTKTITLNLPRVTTTSAELVSYLNEAFPDCRVTINDNWTEVQPGLKRQSTDLVIDWF